jgi:hypothetical protein
MMSLYNFDPSLPAAVFGLITFILVAVVHLRLFWQYQAWHFWAMNVSMMSTEHVTGKTVVELTSIQWSV